MRTQSQVGWVKVRVVGIEASVKREACNGVTVGVGKNVQLGGEFGEIEAAGGGGEGAGDDDGEGLADAIGGVVDDDHGAIREVADGLVFVFAGFGELDGGAVAGGEAGLEGEGEFVEAEDGDVAEAGDFGEVFVVGEEAGIEVAGEGDEHGVDFAFASAGEFLVDGEFDVAIFAEETDFFETAFAAIGFDGVAGIGEALEFVEDEAGDDEGGGEEAGGHDGLDPTVDDDVGVEQERLAFGTVPAEADVGDDDSELVALAAESEGDAEEREGRVDDDLDDVEDGVTFFDGFEPRELEDADAGDEPGAEEADEEAEGGVREVAHGEPDEEPIQGEQEAHEPGSDEGPGPSRVLQTVGDDDAGEDSEREVDGADDADGPWGRW